MFIKYVDLKHPKRMTETELRSIIKKMINEALSSFQNQYEIAKICTGSLFEMFKNGENEMKIDINVDDVRRSIRKIRDISNEVLRKCSMNAVYFYNELKEKNLIN